jgi:dephospho-CoA kinase
MRVIGLTGGIASGKSTVSDIFRALGATVLDADALAREVVEPGRPALEEIRSRFPGVVDASGRLDRAALAARIFGNDADRAALEAIVHPRIQAEVARRTEAFARAGLPVLLYDAALLIENGIHRKLDGVILVWVPEAVQRARLAARDRLNEQEIHDRLAAQLPLEQKRVHATWEVDNSGTFENTRAQVERIWEEIRSPSG